MAIEFSSSATHLRLLPRVIEALVGLIILPQQLRPVRGVARARGQAWEEGASVWLPIESLRRLRLGRSPG